MKDDMMDKSNRVSSAHRGEASEHLVASRLLEDGFTVSWPSAHAAYDLIVESPLSQKLYRVQVKRAFFGVHHRDSPKVWMVDIRQGGQPYPADAFDVLAVVFNFPDGSGDEIIYIPWFGQYRGQKTVDQDMLLEFARFPCASSN